MDYLFKMESVGYGLYAIWSFLDSGFLENGSFACNDRQIYSAEFSANFRVSPLVNKFANSDASDNADTGDN